jgi:hypothetical protein
MGRTALLDFNDDQSECIVLERFRDSEGACARTDKSGEVE